MTATSGATAHFRPVTWLDRRYQLRGVLGECDSGAIFRWMHLSPTLLLPPVIGPLVALGPPIRFTMHANAVTLL